MQRWPYEGKIYSKITCANCITRGLIVLIPHGLLFFVLGNKTLKKISIDASLVQATCVVLTVPTNFLKVLLVNYFEKLKGIACQVSIEHHSTLPYRKLCSIALHKRQVQKKVQSFLCYSVPMKRFNSTTSLNFFDFYYQMKILYHQYVFYFLSYYPIFGNCSSKLTISVMLLSEQTSWSLYIHSSKSILENILLPTNWNFRLVSTTTYDTY